MTLEGTGALITDAHLAALTIEQGATLYTTAISPLYQVKIQESD